MNRLIPIRGRIAMFLAIMVLTAAALAGAESESRWPNATHRGSSQSLAAHAQMTALAGSGPRILQRSDVGATTPRLLALAASFSRTFSYRNTSILLVRTPAVMLRILSAGAPQLDRAPPVASL